MATSPWSKALSPIGLPAPPSAAAGGRGLFDRQIDKGRFVIIHLVVDRGTLLIAGNTHNCQPRRPVRSPAQVLRVSSLKNVGLSKARMAACRASFGRMPAATFSAIAVRGEIGFRRLIADRFGCDGINFASLARIAAPTKAHHLRI